MACRTGNLDNVRWLLEREVAVDIYEGLRPNPPCLLLEAVTGGHTKIVQLLLERNVDINERNDDSGKTALHLVASGGRAAITRLVLKAGADIHTPDKEGKAPLYQVDKEVNNCTSKLIDDQRRSGEAEVTAVWFGDFLEPRIQAIWILM